MFGVATGGDRAPVVFLSSCEGLYFQLYIGARVEKAFLHNVVLAWIKTYPQKFLEVVRRHKSWKWATGVPVFVQTEWDAKEDWKKALASPEELQQAYEVYKYYDALLVTAVGMRKFVVYIEVKTGSFHPEWITKIESAYKQRRISSYLAVVAPARELGYLYDVWLRHNGFLFLFPLEPVLEEMAKDLHALLSSLQPQRNIAV